MDVTSPLVRLGWKSEAAEANTYCPPGLLAALHSELENFGLLIGVTASIAHALASKRIDIARADELSAYMPPDPLVYPSFIQSAGSHALPSETIKALQMFHARLELNRRLADQLILVAQTGNTPAQGELDGLVEAWRGLASTTYVVLLLTERTLDSAGDRQPQRQMSVTQHLLRAVTSGHYPCVDANGLVTIPGWKERRTDLRRRHRTPVKVWRNSIALTAVITNISTEGVGLSDVFGIVKGDQVTIEVAGNRSLKGDVIWAQDNGVGIRLETPLDANDPLLATR